MNKKDALELKRRFTKECSISRLAGCYVDCNKNIIVSFNENFLNLDEEEFYKYLDIAKKTLSGTIGNNILELEFPAEEEEADGRQQLLMKLKSSDLTNETLLNELYSLIIEKYSYTGNYLILVFKDTYDIMKRTSDNLMLDESEEVYEYILVSVCPVDLAKPALGYKPAENRIGARDRDWVVGVPDVGFVFPAFDNRSSDIHKVDFYVKDVKDGHPEFAEEVLACSPRRTAVQQRATLAQIIKKAYSNDEEKSAEAFIGIQESFSARVEEQEALDKARQTESEPIMLDEAVLAEVLEENKIDEGIAGNILRNTISEFTEENTQIGQLVDAHAIKAHAPVKRERELVREVIELKNRLEQPGSDVSIRVSPDRAELIRAEIIDNERYVLIPVGEYERVSINGIDADIE